MTPKEKVIDKMVDVIMKYDDDYCEGMATELAKKLYPLMREPHSCNGLVVPTDCCYLSFTKKKGKARRYKHSLNNLYTVRGEHLIIDIDKDGDVLGIELLYSDECDKPCQRTIPKEVKVELEHFKKTRVPRCQKCKKDFVKETEYTWKPDCDCSPGVRLSLG